jgi:capsule polysaccharide export protein KpsE/RkpR
MNTTSRFHYVLEPVLRKRQWDLDVLQLELAASQHNLAQCEHAHQASLHRMQQAQQELAYLRQAGCVLDPARDTTLVRFLARLEQQHQPLQTALSQARTQHAQITEQTRHALQASKILEKQRELQKHQFNAQAAKVQAKLADDAWLMRGKKLSELAL